LLVPTLQLELRSSGCKRKPPPLWW